MSPTARGELAALERFPRVSGDEPPVTRSVVASVGFSPRERG